MLRCQSPPTLLGFARLTEFFKRSRCRAHWVTADPLCRYSPELCRSTSKLSSEVSTPSPAPNLIRFGTYPLTGFNSPSEFYLRTTATGPTCRNRTVRSPLPRFVPSQRFPSHTERRLSGGSQTTGHAAPPGFHTLSMPCSPCDLPDLFHSGPALRVLSSRL